MPRTLFVFAYVGLSLIVSLPFAVIFGFFRLLGLTALVARPVHWFVAAWSACLLWCCGVRVRVEGLENIPRQKKICFVSNHQSDLDIPVYLRHLPRTVGFVAKTQTLVAPIINLWIVVLGSIFMDRGNVRNAMRSIEKGIRQIRKGNALVLFPEGTRSRGPAMKPFRNGSFKLATRSGALIVPISIDGTWHIWEEKGHVEAARVRVLVHPPIPTEGLDSEGRKALPDRVRAIIQGGLEVIQTPTGSSSLK